MGFYSIFLLHRADYGNPLFFTSALISHAADHQVSAYPLQGYNYTVIRSTTLRTQGATIATVGKAMGQVVKQLLSHVERKSA
jgi:hypothetical protein